ncbi:AMP-binding protein [Actinokineospora sp.]|uniref:AMP-binding protein n=1 Tax=Actinokineospora sp. TaxID=1872133 RepID=UPI0040376BE2
MVYQELAPVAVLSSGFSAPEVAEGQWHVRWDAAGLDPAALVAETMPDTVDFHTSGSTGSSRCWRRTRENLWREAGMLAELVGPGEPRAVVAFAPPIHIFGALATGLLPAHLRVPVWYRSEFFGGLPDTGAKRVVVVATPWIFSLLLAHLDWVRAMDQVTVLYGGAKLPASAGEFLAAAGPDRAVIAETIGSTETGGIGYRLWRGGETPPWTLFADVSFAEPVSADADVPLVVRTPRLAARPGEAAPPTWATGDLVRAVDDRTFRHIGRSGRLVKVNGRRIDLDQVEHALRDVLDCADLAVQPVSDRMIGEHVDLLVALHPGTELNDLDLAAAISAIGVRPRRVRVVDRIARSAMGKLRQDQSLTADAGVAP